jgi:hypothetical protein
MNYINRFIHIIKKHSDIPESFIVAGAIIIISACFGRFFTIKDSRGKRPNLYIILSGAPALTRRSELVKYVNVVLFKALKRFCELCGKDKLNEIKAHLLEGGSPEGLVDDIEALKNEGCECFLLNSSEFGRILQGIKKTNYMAGFQQLLIKLWSGESDYQSFSKRSDVPSRYLSPGTYFGIFGVMQKAKHYLDENMSKTGLIRRLLILVIEGEDLKDWKPPLIREADRCVKELEALGIEIGGKMYEHYQIYEESKQLIQLDYSDEVQKKINKIAEVHEKLARDDDDNPYYLFLVTRWEYYLKVASCYALDNDSLTIEMEHLEKAIKFVDKASKAIRETLQGCLIPIYIRRREDLLKKVGRIVKKKKKILRRKRLAKKSWKNCQEKEKNLKKKNATIPKPIWS